MFFHSLAHTGTDIVQDTRAKHAGERDLMSQRFQTPSGFMARARVGVIKADSANSTVSRLLRILIAAIGCLVLSPHVAAAGALRIRTVSRFTIAISLGTQSPSERSQGESTLIVGPDGLAVGL